MRFRSLVLPLAAALVLGCSEPPSAPTAAPDLRAAQGDRSGWTLLDEWTVPESDAAPVGFIACLNGGVGEEAVVFGGPYGWYEKTVVTPSGNLVGQGWIQSPYEGFRGLETGDLWVTSLDAKINELTRAVDGHWLVHEPISQILTNERTGERVRIQAMYHFELDELGNVVNANARFGETLACHAWK